MNRVTSTAIVLQRREYGDFDLIVTVLTGEHGKRTLIAKSAKKSTKRFPGILEPFNHLQIAYRETKRKGMPVLEEASLLHPLESLRTDVVKTAYASYWTESIAIWMEEGQVREDLFKLLKFALDALNTGEMDAAMVSILFQMRFVGHEGLQPVLEHCTCCQLDIEELPQHNFCIDLGQGGGGLQSVPLRGKRAPAFVQRDVKATAMDQQRRSGKGHAHAILFPRAG